MLYGWEGNRWFGVAIKWFIQLQR